MHHNLHLNQIKRLAVTKAKSDFLLIVAAQNLTMYTVPAW